MAYENTKKVLNQAVADLSQLSALIHQIHWYMRGPGFLTLHPKMDELRDGVEEQLDEISERLITIGGAPYSTLVEFAENSKIALEPTDYNVSTPDRMKALVSAYKYIADLYKNGIQVAEEDNDPVTVDIFTTALADVEKLLWMLDAELA